MEIKIEVLTEDKFKEIVPLIQDYKYKPFHSYPYLSKEQLTGYLLREISDLLIESKNNIAYIAKEDKRIVGLIIVEKLLWDTEFFGVKMAKLGHLVAEGSYKYALEVKNELLNTILSLYSQEGFQFILAKVNTEDISSIHSLEEQGFKMMSACATYLVEKNSLPKFDKDIQSFCNIRPYQDKDLEDLIDISKNSCIKSHFRMDPNIPQEKAADLYSEWIKNSCQGLVDEVIVIESNNQIVGCATFDVDKSFSAVSGWRLGRTPLVVFSESARKSGLHSSYALKLLLEYYFTKVDMVDVIIQVDNIRAAKYWLQMGARMIDCRYVLHRWLAI